MYVNIYEEKWLFVRIGETNDKLFLESYGIWNRKHTKNKKQKCTRNLKQQPILVNYD